MPTPTPVDTTYVSGTTITSDWLNWVNYQVNNQPDYSDVPASNVKYTQGDTGSVERTAESKFQDIISPADFGAVGNGVIDDTLAITNAINAASGAVIDGSGKTYKIFNAISFSAQNIVIQNMVFDVSAVNSQYPLVFAGTQGSPLALSANEGRGSYVIGVANTSTLSDEDYVFFSSQKYWDAATSCLLGQYSKIKTVDSGTQFTLYEDLLYDFDTADSATVSLITPKRNITFRNCKFIGTEAVNQSVLNFQQCADVVVDSCHFEYCNYIACNISRTVNFTATNCSVRYARATGLSYGFAITNGSCGVKVLNSYGEDTRHFVTVGDNDGVSSHIIVANNVIKGSKDAGVDSHSSSNYMIIANNSIECASVEAGVSDGIITQGLNTIITGNTIIGARDHGIIAQNLVDIYEGQYVITNNNIDNSGNGAGTDTGIYVINQTTLGGSVIEGVTIANNTLNGVFDIHIYVNAYSGTISNCAITGNVVYYTANSRSLFINSESSYYVQDVTIANNVFRNDTATDNVMYLLANATGGIRRVAITGNKVNLGDYGIRMYNCSYVTATGNDFYSQNTAKYLVNANCNIIYTDRLVDGFYTVTGSSYTVADDDIDVICAYAGTVTLTLPDPGTWVGRILNIKTVTANAVNSSASNVVTLPNTGSGTTILPGTDGAWIVLRSNGSDWVAMQGS